MNWKSPHSRILPSRTGLPLIMGILNVSTDSFSDGGKYFSESAALEHARKMLQEGAQIIDVGAESTRPNASLLSESEELERLLPHIKALRAEFPSVPLSVDTYKPNVANLAIEAGADIINDVLVKIENGAYPMGDVAAAAGCPIVVTHNIRGEICGENFMEFFMSGMYERLEKTLQAGVEKSQIILDAGVGFGKTHAQNFEIIKNLSQLRRLGCAILLGVSRKSSLASIAGDDMDSRDDATAVVSAFATLQNSADILRVHNVAKNLTAMKIADKLI